MPSDSSSPRPPDKGVLLRDRFSRERQSHQQVGPDIPSQVACLVAASLVVVLAMYLKPAWAENQARIRGATNTLNGRACHLRRVPHTLLREAIFGERVGVSNPHPNPHRDIRLLDGSVLIGGESFRSESGIENAGAPGSSVRGKIEPATFLPLGGIERRHLGRHEFKRHAGDGYDLERGTLAGVDYYTGEHRIAVGVLGGSWWAHYEPLRLDEYPRAFVRVESFVGDFPQCFGVNDVETRQDSDDDGGESRDGAVVAVKKIDDYVEPRDIPSYSSPDCYDRPHYVLG